MVNILAIMKVIACSIHKRTLHVNTQFATALLEVHCLAHVSRI